MEERLVIVGPRFLVVNLSLMITNVDMVLTIFNHLSISITID